MEQAPPPGSPESLELKRRYWQEMFARGWVSIEEFEAVGRLHGWVAPTRSAQVLTGASVLGYVLLGLGAVAEIAGSRNPELRGPLSTLIEVLRLVGDQLGVL